MDTNGASTLTQRSLKVPVDGAELNVRVLSHAAAADHAARPVVVFLHEALGSVAQWKSFPAELCASMGVDGIVYDRQGHGQSSPLLAPRTMRFYSEEAGEVLPTLLAALGIRRPILFGHSDGATIALKFASLFPDEPAGIVSVAAHVIIEDETVNGIRQAQTAYRDTDLRLKLARYHGDKTDALFSAWADTWLEPSCADWEMLEDLALIRCPVLAMQGSEDAYGTVRQLDCIREHCNGPVQMAMLKDCGHVPHHEARERTIEAVISFVATLP